MSGLERPALFQDRALLGHSGQYLNWKIEADGLTERDWQWAAKRVAEKYSFREILAIPTGGDRFAQALQYYARPNGHLLLIVDDVLTTGISMTEARQMVFLKRGLIPVLGIVLFSRVHLDPSFWVKAIFSYWGDQ